jgi:ATP/maltotriose-dependent transcriptional regulator MalT
MLGYDYLRAGRYDEARDMFQQCAALLDKLGEASLSGFGVDPQIGIALLDTVAGNYKAALESFAQACRRCDEQGNDQDGATAYYGMANAYAAQGDYDRAYACAGRAYALTEQTGNRWMMAYVLLLMGDVERHLNRLVQARQYYQSSADIKQEMSDPEGVALALQRLGRVACMKENYDEAGDLFSKSLSYYQDINDPGGLAATLHGLEDTAWAQGDSSLAIRYYHDALRIALEIQWVPLILSILVSTQRIWVSSQPARAIEVLAFVQWHPAAERETQELAAQQLTVLQRNVKPGHIVRNRSTETEADIAREVLAELSLLKTNPFLMSRERPPQSGSSANDALLDPLTERELEVLSLMAQGLTNRQIAEQLVVVLGTIKAHSHSIYSKLGVNNRVQAIRRAEELSLL